jgi:hypothetical protein
MTYLCIKCKAIWVVGEPSSEFSGGLCDTCITNYIRERQIKSGFEDCFRRATEVCGKVDCRYHEHCCRYLKGYKIPQEYFEQNICEL